MTVSAGINISSAPPQPLLSHSTASISELDSKHELNCYWVLVCSVWLWCIVKNKSPLVHSDLSYCLSGGSSPVTAELVSKTFNPGRGLQLHRVIKSKELPQEDSHTSRSGLKVNYFRFYFLKVTFRDEYLFCFPPSASRLWPFTSCRLWWKLCVRLNRWKRKGWTDFWDK